MNNHKHTFGSPTVSFAWRILAARLRMWCGPVISSLCGCFEYWCCCVGCKRLYLGRSGGKNLEEMRKDMDNTCLRDAKFIKVLPFELFVSGVKVERL